MYNLIFFLFGFDSGGVGIVWFVLWLFVAFDSPAKHPRVSTEERIYIESSIEADNVGKHNQKVNQRSYICTFELGGYFLKPNCIMLSVCMVVIINYAVIIILKYYHQYV